MVRLRRAVRSRPLVVAALAAAAAVVAFATATLVFPYRSLNHDEAVYLQQAALLLDGRLFLQPPVADAFRPWFFVSSPRGLYSKYAPVTAAIYAAGRLAGDYQYALSAVAAGNVALLYGVVRDAWDHRTAAVAAVSLLASPLFVVQSGVFLPYAPTTLLNLAFAFAYFRAERTDSTVWAGVAGVAVGLAFFARPYTAVLFAAPFIAHAGWTLWAAAPAWPDCVARRAATAGLGAAGVAVALGYNAVVTGDPLVFPYEAFAPLDGLGFGHREILGYDQLYTLSLALRSNAEVVGSFLRNWAPFGALGSVLAVVGGAVVARREAWTWRRAVLGGVAVSVCGGNLAFWGNRNILGSLPDHTDGLIHALGPYYHFDVLVPVSAFAAVGVLAVVDRARRVAAVRVGRQSGVAVVLVVGLVLGASAVAATAPPVAENTDVTANYAAAYQPFEPSPPENAVVFVPDPYGDWLNHPFQPLRNTPGFDGPTVYAAGDRAPAVAAAYPDRDLYRYTYRGAWSPQGDTPVEPVLREVSLVTGEAVTATASFGVPSWTAGATVTVTAGGERAHYALTGVDNRSRATVDMHVTDGRVTLSGPVAGADADSVPVNGSTVSMSVLVDGGYGAGFRYRVELPVSTAGQQYRAVTPSRSLCTDLQVCGGPSSTYVPGSGPEGAWINVSVATGRRTAATGGVPRRRL
ncbi:glycosyltransferase family 39 protein [Halobacterium sp. BOL4-2]|uniref:ArnT family glycosyltransferase n=1 Tax=Halobacterium sp. BOL4-2 TaxID=2810537 RepID=UPI001965B760|nr:glycosyltransferase family 39 protein [Halobacterium sp. BOL4-2]QRY25485.1 glycosyltransferase family 39 protein [Halobacterium sp. BOL4-2]